MPAGRCSSCALNAAKWNLDPNRIAVGGGSQGTLPALYVGCAGDRADPESSDPVQRVSTKVTCVAAYRSQPTIDPQRMQEWVPGVKWVRTSLGCKFEESLARREELLPLIKQWSPDWLVHAGAPPIYFENERGPDEARGGDGGELQGPLAGVGAGLPEAGPAGGRRRAT